MQVDILQMFLFIATNGKLYRVKVSVGVLLKDKILVTAQEQLEPSSMFTMTAIEPLQVRLFSSRCCYPGIALRSAYKFLSALSVNVPQPKMCHSL